MTAYTDTLGACEVSLMVVRESDSQKPRIDGPEQAADYYRRFIQPTITNPDLERVWTVMLNTRKQARMHCEVARGTVNTVQIEPREFFRPAILAAATSLIVFHNHPSGDPSPSEDDVRMTLNLIKAGILLHIQIADHLIMGDARPDYKGWMSLRELGYFSM